MAGFVNEKVVERVRRYLERNIPESVDVEELAKLKEDIANLIDVNAVIRDYERAFIDMIGKLAFLYERYNNVHIETEMKIDSHSSVTIYHLPKVKINPRSLIIEICPQVHRIWDGGGRALKEVIVRVQPYYVFYI